MARLFAVLGLCLLAAFPVAAAERLVSADGAVTEILYAVGEEGRLVGVDTTSQHPPQAQDLPSVGYKRNLSAEGVLSLAPDRLLVTDDAGPPQVLEQLAGAGLAVTSIPDEPSVAGLLTKIRKVAALVGREREGEALIAEIEENLASLQLLLSPAASAPRVLFLLHTGSGQDIAAGRDTVADTMIRLAGGENVLHERVSGYRPLNAESALAAAPEVILLTERTLASLGGVDGLLGRAGLAATPAGRARRIVAMDGPLLLAFGPRLGEAATALAQALGTLSSRD
jgi:iron complex transport system substrate-binding protein